MKRLGLIFAALGLLVTSTAFAANLAPTVDKPSSINEQITRLLRNPEFIVDHEMQANVLFVLNDDKEIVVLSVETNDAEVVAYIKSRLSLQKLDSDLEMGKQYILPVRIKSKK